MATTSTPTSQLVSTGTWQLDPVHSRVGFAVDYLVGTFSGSFSPVEGRLEGSDDGSATLTGKARADAIHVQDENLNAHLLSPEFFDAERTPELTFESRDIARDGDRLTVNGELTIRGVAQSVTLTGTIGEPLTDPYGKERIGVTLTGQVDRTTFGLNWNAPLPSGEPALANDVELSAELYFVEA
jgi:polyisoprenoid-binding protein YceI